MRCFEEKFRFEMTKINDFCILYDVSLLHEIQEILGLKTCATCKNFSEKSRYIVLHTNYFLDLVANPDCSRKRHLLATAVGVPTSRYF